MKSKTAAGASSRRPFLPRAGVFLLGMLAALSSLPAASAVDVSQSPLYIGSNVPGNLALTPSVEFPTAISVANLPRNGTYSPAVRRVGYFDSDKCYGYHFSAVETERHFFPVGPSFGFVCPGNQWSGNFMNWAATQTIDPFRSALTGGYRVKDTINETWVEKAIADRPNEANFPRRLVNNAGVVTDATPITWGSVRMRIDGLGNKMWFTQEGGGNVGTGANLVAYNPAVHNLDFAPLGVPAVNANQAVYEVSVRVKVCDATIGLESNCKAYSSGFYKPEGLIQEYSNRILYSIFGYQNRDEQLFDGGILRANQKFVGPQTYYPELGPLPNPNAEWDPATGIFVQNPDLADAAATTAAIGGAACTIPGGCDIRNSGVINYINKFGQMQTGKNIKSFDNVSELYYTAIRYFRNLGDVARYSELSGTRENRYRQADGFPVIAGANWQDPIRYQCQTNVILGIGDTNTWHDKNLPGPTNGTNEPAKPPEVLADNTVNVVDNLRDIRLMEGDTPAAALARATANTYSHANNSAYMAALAYDAHTRDIRPPGPNAMPGKQTISTHWVDVVEFDDFKTTNTNQFWLTAKYGGFRVPPGYDPDTMTAPLPNAWWWGSGDLVNGNAAFRRADNFYVASDAQKMVDSLTLAFQNIAAELVGAGGSFASNTTKLEVGATTYQAQFYSASWRGEVSAFAVNPVTGALTFTWSAGSKFPAWGSRNIKFNNGGVLANFAHGALGATPLGVENVDTINYLRGDRSNEQPVGPLRTRTGILGDIVNSQPVYVGSPNPRLHIGATFNGAAVYPAFAAAQAARTPVLYVGANDGMLHGFNGTSGAAGGEEVFAFVPTAAMVDLYKYTLPGYVHQYYVDGELTVADIYDTGAGAWKTILVGTLGRGGRGMFALDVTNPAAISLLWEKDSASMPQLGNNLGKPIIAQVANGDWRVLLGNGPNSAGDDARLIMVDVMSGAVTVSGSLDAGGNGLSGVQAWASLPGGFVDTVYAGDLKGNMWKLENLVGVPSATKLFTANPGVVQPITAAPLVARNAATADTWVFFGTGKYISGGDIANTDVQSWYGLIDRGALIPGDRSTLDPIAILLEGTVGGFEARVIEANAAPGLDGWYMDLVSPAPVGARGERMVLPNLFQGLSLIGTTRIPEANDVCSPSGKGFVMAVSPFTGGRLPQIFFDLNGDGIFSAPGDTLGGFPVTGIGLPSSPNNPIFIGDIMQVSLDNGGSATVKTNSGGFGQRRVSWREVVRN